MSQCPHVGHCPTFSSTYAIRTSDCRHFCRFIGPEPRLRTHYSHHMTIAAIVIAAIKVSARRSYWVAMRCQSLSLPNMFSILWRCLYCALQKAAGDFRPFRGGMHEPIPLAFSAARYSSESYPLSAIMIALWPCGRAVYRAFAPI